MAEERVQRRLATILAADVVGYSRLMEQDEASTLAALKARRRGVLEPLVAKHQGRIFKVTGDGVLVEFASAVNAVQCAMDLQHGMAIANGDAPDSCHIVLRIGVNLGDVMVEGGDLYGDGINIAARLEALADPGGICVSAAVQDQVARRLPLAFDDLGEQVLKNIARPMHVYRVAAEVLPIQAADRSLPTRPSIAVLPFTNLSGDADQEYFSDGITEDIITELSRFHSLFVIARNSSFQYRDKGVDVKRVGRELGVQFVIEGSIRKFGSRMRVTAQLINAVTGNHIWAERYDRELQDMFTLQDDLVHAVVATVSGRVDAAGRDRSASLSPDGLEAYELHLRAKSLYLKYTRSDNEQARILAQRAMKIDPNNAVIAAFYAAYCYTDYISDWVVDLDQSLSTALEFAKRAVTLDDADAIARAVLASMYITIGNFAEGRIHIEKALELNPNDTETRGLYGWFLSCAGEPDKAIEQFEIVRHHNPFDMSWLPWVRGQAYFGARRYDEAIAIFNQAHQSNNEVNAWLAASNALAGRVGEARAKLQEFLQGAERDMVHFPGKQAEEWRKYLQRSCPYQDPRDFEHLSDGLRKAGLPI